MTHAPQHHARVEGLVRVEGPPDEVRAAESRLKVVLDQVGALDAEVEALSEALARFTQQHDAELGPSYEAVDRAVGAVRRLQRLQDELRRLTAALEQPAPPARRRRVTKRRRSAGPLTDEEEPEAEAEDPDALAEEALAGAREEAKLLKALFRRLARLLHPDLARDEEERGRLTRVMAQVNASYERGDRTALELLAEKVGAGEPPEELSAQERLEHLRRRIAALEQAASALRQQREQLERTATFGLHREAEQRRAAGRDYFAETKRELGEEVATTIADAWHRLVALERAASAFSAQWSEQMADLKRAQGKAGLARAFDPLAESALVRRGLARLEAKRVTAQARELARELEAQATEAPWQLTLTLLAYFAERAVRPPDGLRTQEDWRARYEALCEEAPPFDRALVQLPAHLEVGLRAQDRQVQAGVQLRSPELLAGVALALEHETVAALAREVFAALGPRESCKACREEVSLLHLLRTRGLDEQNALVCPRCGCVQKRYWLYSRNDGLEALQPDALTLGVVVEQVVRFGSATLGFQLLPKEREKLRAAALLDRLWECYFVPYKLEVPRAALELYRGRSALPASAAVPKGIVGARLKKGAPHSSREAVELLRSRIERRFRA